MATNYTRKSYTASNGIKLDVIKTDASNIMLVDLAGKKNLADCGKFLCRMGITVLN